MPLLQPTDSMRTADGWRTKMSQIKLRYDASPLSGA
jgi:hypothetical protein